MRGEVALVREQGQEFAVLAVRNHVLASPTDREEMMNFGEAQFGVPTALVGENGRLWGPPDIVRWLESVFIEQLPWRDFTIS